MDVACSQEWPWHLCSVRVARVVPCRAAAPLEGAYLSCAWVWLRGGCCCCAISALAAPLRLDSNPFSNPLSLLPVSSFLVASGSVASKADRWLHASGGSRHSPRQRRSSAAATTPPAQTSAASFWPVLEPRTTTRFLTPPRLSRSKLQKGCTYICRPGLTPT